MDLLWSIDVEFANKAKHEDNNWKKVEHAVVESAEAPRLIPTLANNKASSQVHDCEQDYASIWETFEQRPHRWLEKKGIARSVGVKADNRAEKHKGDKDCQVEAISTAPLATAFWRGPSSR